MNKENERIINLTEYGELKSLNGLNIEQKKIAILKSLEIINESKNSLLNCEEIKMFKNDLIKYFSEKLNKIEEDLEEALENIDYLMELNEKVKDIELNKDYDGDGINNKNEILRGTNIYISDKEINENEEKNIEWEF